MPKKKTAWQEGYEDAKAGNPISYSSDMSWVQRRNYKKGYDAGSKK